MKPAHLIVMTLAFSFAMSNHAYASAADIPRQAFQPLKQLAKNSGGTLEVIWNDDTQTPKLLSGQLTPASAHSLTWIAYGIMDQMKGLYGLKNPKSNLKVVEVGTISDDLSFVRFQHVMFRTPVWGDELVIEIDHDGIVRRIFGTIHPHLEEQIFNRPMIPAISEQEALLTAQAAFQDSLSGYSEPELSTYYLPTRKGTPLVYVLTFHHMEQPTRVRIVMVHALTGTIIPE